MSNLAQILLNPCYSLDDTLFESRCAYPETHIDILGKHTIQSCNHSCLQSTLIHHNASFQFDNDCNGATASFRLGACIGWKVRGWYRPHNYWFIPRWWPCLEEFGHSQIAVLLREKYLHILSCWLAIKYSTHSIIMIGRKLLNKIIALDLIST